MNTDSVVQRSLIMNTSSSYTPVAQSGQSNGLFAKEEPSLMNPRNQRSEAGYIGERRKRI